MNNFTCTLCGEKFDDFNSMWKHLLNKHKAYSNTCKFCAVNLSNLNTDRLKNELGLYIDLEVSKDIDEVKYNDYFFVGIYIDDNSRTFSGLMDKLKNLKIVAKKFGIEPDVLVLNGINKFEENYNTVKVLLFKKTIDDRDYFRILSDMIKLNNDDSSIQELKNEMKPSSANTINIDGGIVNFIKGYNYQCPLCGTVFSDGEFTLKKHLEEFHNVRNVEDLLQLVDYKVPVLSKEAIEKIGLFKSAVLDVLYKLNLDGSVWFNNTYGLNYEFLIKVNTPTLTLMKFEEIVETVFIEGYKHFGGVITKFILDDVNVKCGETFIKFGLEFRE